MENIHEYLEQAGFPELTVDYELMVTQLKSQREEDLNQGRPAMPLVLIPGFALARLIHQVTND